VNDTSNQLDPQVQENILITDMENSSLSAIVKLSYEDGVLPDTLDSGEELLQNTLKGGTTYHVAIVAFTKAQVSVTVHVMCLIYRVTLHLVCSVFSLTHSPATTRLILSSLSVNGLVLFLCVSIPSTRYCDPLYDLCCCTLDSSVRTAVISDLPFLLNS